MSITIISSPPTPIIPAGNDILISVSGNTFGLPGVSQYQFVAKFNNVPTIFATFAVMLKTFPDPSTGIGMFNFKNIPSSYISFDFFTSGTPQVIPCFNSSVKHIYYIGEQYISGNTVVQKFDQTSTSQVFAINTALTYQHEFDTTLSNFVLQTAVGNALFFMTDHAPNASNGFDATVYEGWNDYAYLYNTFTSTFFDCWKLTVYSDSFTTQIGQYFLPIAGQNLNIATPLPKISGATSVMCANFSPGALRLIPSGGTKVVTGNASDILPISAVSYILQPGWQTSTTLQTYSNSQIRCSIGQNCGRTANTAHQLFWLNGFGGFDSWLFNKKTETTQVKKTQKYKRTPTNLRSESRFNQPVSTVLQDTLTLNSEFLTDTDISVLKYMFSSPLLFMVDSLGVCTAVRIQEDSFRIVKKVNQKTYSLSLTIEQSYNDYRQVF